MHCVLDITLSRPPCIPIKLTQKMDPNPPEVISCLTYELKTSHNEAGTRQGTRISDWHQGERKAGKQYE